MSGCSAPMASAATARVVALTSRGQNRRSCPVAVKASRSNRVLSEVPEPSSTRVSAPERAATSADRASRIARSREVG